MAKPRRWDAAATAPPPARAASGSLGIPSYGRCDQSGQLRWTLLPAGGGQWRSTLRRAQALAPFTDDGAELARWLVTRKIEGQRDVLVEWQRPAGALEAVLRQVHVAKYLRQFRPLEARAADAYWTGWKGLPLHFAPPSHARRVPEHWLTFRERGSPLTDGGRNAADPVNALLNYAYALLEAEALIACHEAGLEPYLAVLHTDQDGRRSLVYDVMEPVRPVADRLVLNLVRSHPFRPGELWGLRDGRCRLDQELCAHLWPWMPTFRRALGPVISFLLSRLRKGIKYSERDRRSGGRGYWNPSAEPPALRSSGACQSCGVLLEGVLNRLYCDTCLPQRRQEVTADSLEGGNKRLRQLRYEGKDPAHGGAAADARRERLAKNKSAVREWALAHERPDPEEFRRTIFPGLQGVTLAKIMQATELCSGYCSMIRRGKYIPHPRHWESLKALTIQQSVQKKLCKQLKT